MVFIDPDHDMMQIVFWKVKDRIKITKYYTDFNNYDFTLTDSKTNKERKISSKEAMRYAKLQQIKKEAKNVILLKQAIQATGSLPMDREDLRQSMQVINQVAKEVQQGRNYIIFAEGTRSKMGNKLLEFKGGSFKAAQKAKCPIVPCALINSFVPFDENSVRQVTVKLLYLKPLYYEEYRHMRSNEIAEEVKRRIEEAIEKNL